MRFTEAREHALRRVIQLPGSVESRTVSTVASTVPGLVVDFPAREGDTVKKGQPLAQLRRQTLEIGLR
ncbi:MAG: biotin/lipoyl-binding protein, partial [Woeseiaceae bacterium]